MSLPLPVDWTADLYAQQQQSGLPLKVALPLSLDPKTNIMTIFPASGTNTGTITAAAQTLGGVKNFLALPQSLVAPLNNADLTTKAYVDGLVAKGISWQNAIQHGFLAAPPLGPANGDRFIATATGGGFTQNNIYTYDLPGLAWVETVAVEGMALYNESNVAPFANSCVIFLDTGAWGNIGGSVLHSSLQDVPVGSLTHTTINSYLNQAVQTTSDTTFNSVKVGTFVDRDDASFPLLNRWYRIRAPAASILFDCELHHRPYGHFSLEFYAANPTFNLTIQHLVRSGTFNVRAAIYSENSTGLSHVYVAASGSYTIEFIAFRGSAANTLSVLDCGPTSADPTDLTPGDYTKRYDTSTDMRFVGQGLGQTILYGDGSVPQLYLSGDLGLTNYATLQTSAAGDLTLNATGNDINLHSTDTVHVLNTTVSTSTTTGALIVSGGVGVADSIYSSAIVSGTLKGANISVLPGAMPALNTWYRLWAPTLSALDAMFTLARYPYGRTKITLYSSGLATVQICDDQSGNVLVRGLIARETSTSLYHYYLASVAGYAMYLDAINSNVSTGLGDVSWTDCGPTSADPTDLTPADYTILADSASSAGNYVGMSTGRINMFAAANQLALYNDYARVNALVASVDAAGDCVLNASGNNLNFHSSDIVGVLNTTAATSKTTGALVVSGGMGVVGNAYASSYTAINAGTQLSLQRPTLTDKADFTVDNTGYLTINTSGNRVNIDVSDSLRVLATTAATSKTTGCLIISGGVGAAGDIYATNINASTKFQSSLMYLYGATPGTTYGGVGFDYYTDGTTPVIPDAGLQPANLYFNQGTISLQCASIAGGSPANVLSASSGFLTSYAKTTITTTAAPQLKVAYDGTDYCEMNVSTTQTEIKPFSGNLNLNPDGNIVHRYEYDDLQCLTSSRTQGGDGAVLTQANGSDLFCFMFTSGLLKRLEWSAQMPHTWVEGGVITPHVHWMPSSTDTGYVQWAIRIMVQNQSGDATIFSLGNSTAYTVNATANSVAWKAQVDAFAGITLTNKTVSCTIIGNLRREGGGDTFTGDAYLLGFDLHYAKDKLGTTSI